LFGIQGTALQWFQSYLSSRSFSVLANGTKSPPLPVTCGVPQGSVLGPLLFIIYTTPLSSLLSASSANHHLYADDTQLFISFTPQSFVSTIQSLQNTIAAVANWMSANLLCLNQSKSEFMVIGLPKQLSKINQPSLAMPDNTILISVDSARNLGIIFDSHLTLSKHVSALTSSCFYHIRDLKRVRNCLSAETATLIATSLIHTKLDYCNSLFLNLPSCLINRLQLIQNAAARAVSRTKQFDHITPILKSFHWLRIRERILFKIASLSYNALQFRRPSYIHDLLTIQKSNRTRSSDVITLERPVNPSRLKITDRSFYFQAPAIWNSLPNTLRQRSNPGSPHHTLGLSPKQFHSKLKTYLFTSSYSPT
jgi:Reverse transcriptase (RNA-dependent DNA polymerase)